ncbi:MAG TPA: hypothetical protein VGU01_13745 [Sphingomicrobium sp.]|nr:hypothetical protein [Sphingomicrobium sp.]
MNHAALEFIKRLPEGAKAERELIETAFRFPDAMRTKAAAVRADRNLSEDGKSHALRKLVSEGGMAEHFGQVKAQAKAWQADIQNARAAMKPKAPDKGDLGAAVRDWEIREFLRGLPDAQRMRAALETPEFAAAVVNAPPILSALSSEVHDLVVEAAIERELGPRVEALRQREQIVETVAAALKVAEGRIFSEAGLEAGEL